MDGPIIDTHVHLWDAEKFRYPWLDEITALNRSFLLDDYNDATSGLEIEGFVFVQCEAVPDQALAEAEWIASLAESDTRIRGIVPFAPLEKGDDARPHLEKLSAMPLVKGLRRHFQFEPDPEFCLRPDVINGIQLLPGYGLSFDILISHIHLVNTIRLVWQCPEVTFILDHIAKPNIKEQLFEPWKKEIRELAQIPNVCCKVSGLVTEADHETWSKEDLKPYIDHVVECFGFDRVLFGGDWPVVTLAAKYSQWLEALEWALTGCSDDEMNKLFHDNARRVYRFTD